ncbi:mRNA interferase YafQ [Synergistales bacterium]|nr:mRNA interferase YafQ [Synergistales bacterium]
MLDIDYSTALKKDIKRVMIRGRDILKIFLPIAILLSGQPLPAVYRDHPLKGKWAGHRDFHVESDWVVIYRITDGVLRIERTGAHSELFNE